MNSPDLLELFNQSIKELTSHIPNDWDDVFDALRQSGNRKIVGSLENYTQPPEGGIAFITFDYGIDGVTIEISKYARSLEDIYGRANGFSIHLIGEVFYPPASSVLSDRWHRHILKGINGWDKWDGGKWFHALFRRKMPSGSIESDHLAKEMLNQAISIAVRLGRYLIENDIGLLIPVNIASNPGNFALTLGLALAAEILGMRVLNINHDFYWEEGRLPSERGSNEEAGIRDHFFTNSENKSFFALFQALYPYNSKKWLQANINTLQSKTLIEDFHFSAKRVFEVTTYVGDKFFENFSKDDKNYARLRMSFILSNGDSVLRPVPLDDHMTDLAEWMKNQTPVILGVRPRLSIDLQSDELIILLQPTRIIDRKRIGRNLDLIASLFQSSALRSDFTEKPARQLLLHVTGPVPKEHKADLKLVLQSYGDLIKSLPSELAERVFLSFSVGHQDHTSFASNAFTPLGVEEIFRMADVVVFPSDSEGRGLPIIEASAVGIPIICSRYRPEKVFAEVVGEHLPKELQIQYTLFPGGDFSQQFLAEVAELLLFPQTNQIKISHNKKAVRARYSRKSMQKKFADLIEKLVE